MKQSEKVKSFKKLCGSYNNAKISVKELNDEIELCYGSLGGLKGYDPSKIIIHSPKNLDAEYKTRDKIEKLIKKRTFYESIVDYVDDVLNKLDKIPLSDRIDVKQAIKDVYINGESLDKMGREKYYVVASALSKEINKAIEKALKY